jgi:putative transcriptional regulator
MTVDSLRGQILIASPSMLDPNFHRTVILVAEHNDEGAMGVVLNRPTEATVTDAVPALEELVDGDEPVFAGGPVSQTGVLVIAEFDDPDDAAIPVLDDVGVMALEGDLLTAASAVRRTRAFAGHAGWGPGQLEDELEEDAWIVATAERDDVFGEQPEALWSVVLRRQGGQFALLARMPPDPSLN